MGYERRVAKSKARLISSNARMNFPPNVLGNKNVSSTSNSAVFAVSPEIQLFRLQDFVDVRTLLIADILDDF